MSMNRGLRSVPVVLACTALACAAGCGSSESKGTSSTTTDKTSSTSAAFKGGLPGPGKINYASPPANAPVQSGFVTITYHEFAIEPDTLKAKVGSQLKWINKHTEKC